MRHLLFATLLLFGLSAAAQRTIYSHAIGYWRNGPVVYITPLIEASESMTKAQLTERFRARFPELRDIPGNDLDVLLFGTREEGEESRRTLHAKYALRKLQAAMLEERKAAADTLPSDHR
jgi:hypothetical protein